MDGSLPVQKSWIVQVTKGGVAIPCVLTAAVTGLGKLSP